MCHSHLYCISSKRGQGGGDWDRDEPVPTRCLHHPHKASLAAPVGKDNASALGLPPKGEDKSCPWCAGNQMVISTPVLQPGHRSVLLSTLSPDFTGQKGECKA